MVAQVATCAECVICLGSLDQGITVLTRWEDISVLKVFFFSCLGLGISGMVSSYPKGHNTLLNTTEFLKPYPAFSQ